MVPKEFFFGVKVLFQSMDFFFNDFRRLELIPCWFFLLLFVPSGYEYLLLSSKMDGKIQYHATRNDSAALFLLYTNAFWTYLSNRRTVCEYLSSGLGLNRML